MPDWFPKEIAERLKACMRTFKSNIKTGLKNGKDTWPENFDFSIYTSYAHGVFGNPITLFRFRYLKIDFE